MLQSGGHMASETERICVVSNIITIMTLVTQATLSMTEMEHKLLDLITYIIMKSCLSCNIVLKWKKD